MEMLLGIPSLTSYDAVANPILDWDNKPSNSDPFTATLPAQSIICAKTPALESLSSSDPMRRVMRRHPGSGISLELGLSSSLTQRASEWDHVSLRTMKQSS
jgi:hypothetical protein